MKNNYYGRRMDDNPVPKPELLAGGGTPYHYIEVYEYALDLVADLVLFLESDLADQRGSDLSQSTLDRLQEINNWMAQNELWEPSKSGR